MIEEISMYTRVCVSNCVCVSAPPSSLLSALANRAFFRCPFWVFVSLVIVLGVEEFQRRKLRCQYRNNKPSIEQIDQSRTNLEGTASSLENMTPAPSPMILPGMCCAIFCSFTTDNSFVIYPQMQSLAGSPA